MNVYDWFGPVVQHPVFVEPKQQKRNSACAHAQADQRLCYSLPIKNNISNAASKLSIIKHVYVAEHKGFCVDKSHAPKAGFLAIRPDETGCILSDILSAVPKENIPNVPCHKNVWIEICDFWRRIIA